MKHVEIVVSTPGIWRRDQRKEKITAFGRAGDCFCEVLSALAWDGGQGDEGGGAVIGADGKGKTLRLAVEPRWGENRVFEREFANERRLFGWEQKRVVEVAVEVMRGLVERVKRVREVKFMGGFVGPYQKLEPGHPRETRWEYLDESWRRIVEGDGMEMETKY